MTPRRQALEALRADEDSDDPASARERADDALCDLLNALGFEDVVQAYHRVPKEY